MRCIPWERQSCSWCVCMPVPGSRRGSRWWCQCLHTSWSATRGEVVLSTCLGLPLTENGAQIHFRGWWWLGQEGREEEIEEYQSKTTSQPGNRVILGSANTQAAWSFKETSALHQSLPLPVWEWFLEVKQKLMPTDKHFLLSRVAYVLGDNSGHQSVCLRDKVRTKELDSLCFEHSCADFVLWEMHDASWVTGLERT